MMKHSLLEFIENKLNQHNVSFARCCYRWQVYYDEPDHRLCPRHIDCIDSGAGPIADAFFIAFKFPNFFRRLTAEGALTVAFVPTFSRLLQDKGKKDALEFAEEVISFMGIGLFLFSFFVIIFMPTVMLGLAPGFIEQDWLFDLTVELARITFIYLTPISLVALLGGILNSFGKFGAMASAPILLNIILIVSLVFFENSMETKGHVLAIAVAISGVSIYLASRSMPSEW